MNAPIKHLTNAKAALLTALLLGLGASALADGTTPATTITAQTVTPTAPITVPVLPLGQPAPGLRPMPPTPGQAGAPAQHGPRGGQAPRGAGPGQMAQCAPGAGMVMRPAPGGQGNAGRARPTPPTPGTTSAQPAAPKVPKADKMDRGMGPKDKGMGKGKKGGKGEGCPPAQKGMVGGQPQPGAATSGQATSNLAPAARDLGRLDALAAQTSDARIRGYLNDARSYLQSASKAQQKAGRDLFHAAEALVRGVQAPQR